MAVQKIKLSNHRRATWEDIKQRTFMDTITGWWYELVCEGNRYIVFKNLSTLNTFTVERRYLMSFIKFGRYTVPKTA